MYLQKYKQTAHTKSQIKTKISSSFKLCKPILAYSTSFTELP